MTIREIETRSGLTRANVRFYEAEGLLSPARGENGYRDYTPDDLETLRRVRLLRTLGFSLEEIRALQRGDMELPAALDRRVEELDRSKEALDRSQAVCRELRDAGTGYAALDAQHWLETLERPAALPQPPQSAVLAQDVTPKVRSPWRRFFARYLDLFLCRTVWYCAFLLLSGRSPANWGRGVTITADILGVVTLLFTEPLFLRLFAATPGKWLLGLSVTEDGARRLSYHAALERTFLALWYGSGLTVVIIDLIRLWKSRTACEEGETLPWEYSSELRLKDEAPWRIFAYLACCAAAIGAIALSVTVSLAPVNRGGVTVGEFCENYEHYRAYYNYSGQYTLNADGTWTDHSGTGSAIYISMFDDSAPPEFHFTEADGEMTGLSFSHAAEGEEWARLPSVETSLSVLSFVAAQPEAGLRGSEARALAQRLSRSPLTSFETEVCGVRVVYEVEYENYAPFDSAALLWSPDRSAGTPSYSYSFTMEKVS